MHTRLAQPPPHAFDSPGLIARFALGPGLRRDDGVVYTVCALAHAALSPPRAPPMRLAALALTLALLAPMARADPIPAAVTNGPAPDAAFPASMQTLRVPSHGAALNAVFYLAAGKGDHPTLLLMHGFPGNEQNLDVAQAARRAGWNVLTLHYRGSWGSPGTFSFTHVIEDADAAVALLFDPVAAAKYHIDTHRVVVAGHSMGGFAAGWAAAHEPRVAGLVMISGAQMGSIKPTPKVLAEFTDNVIPLVGCTVDGLLAESAAHEDAWKFAHWAPALKTRPALLIGANDGTQPGMHELADALQGLGDKDVTELHWATDHPYSDRRMQLQGTVVAWLQHLP
jgi:pimeloyl-ACP methyl ester carboxylesterase